MAITKNRHTYLQEVAEDENCELCNLPVDLCDCPVCPVCGDQGNSQCLELHFTRDMLVEVRVEVRNG